MCFLLTLRAQLTKSSSLVMTYSPLLLATDAGLAAATAVLFSLTGTKLQQEMWDACYVHRVLGSCVLFTLMFRKTHVVTAFSLFALL